MPYAEMLQKIMNEKKLTAKEIIKKCKEQGIEFDEGYFSKIKCGKKNPPSEKVSRAIAKVCNVDERLLIIEGYIDKSPNIIQEAFKSINFIAKSATAKLLKIIKKGNFNELQNYLDTQPISDTIIEIIDKKEKHIEFLENNYYFESLGNGFGISMQLKEPIGFIIEDDAMSPIIQKGDKVSIDTDTKNFISSDILLIQYKKNLYVRYVNKVNSTFKLTPIVRTYKEIICNKEDFKIIGRINSIIRNI